MVRHSVLGEITPDMWLMLRAILVESDMAPDGQFSVADIVRLCSLTALTERAVRDFCAALVQHAWMTPPVESEIGGQQVRVYRLTDLGRERIRALFAS